jgi:homoserine O-acetyltransferase
MMLMAETTANPRFLRAISAPGADVGHTITFEAPVALDAGRSLAPVTVAYMTYGTLNPTKSNVVLVCHALTGDQFAASASPITGKPGWWDVMVGPGKPIDTDRYFVVCSNILGGCMGSTGPAEIDPTTGKPFGLTFPLVTVRDMVRAQAMLLDALGIDKILCVIGGSLGGMQVLQWAASYPERVISAVPIATAARHSAQNIAFHEVAAHITYLSETALQRKFGRNLQNRQSVSFEFRPDFQIESYLHHQGMTFVDRFDANSYLYITRAMDYFDLAADYDGVLANAFRGSKTRFCIISFTSDWLFPTAENKLVAHALNAAAANVSFVEIETDRGHDAFLLDEPEMFATVRGFLSSVAHAHGLT